MPKKSTCKIRVTSVTLPTSTRGVNVDGIGQIRIHSLDQIEDNIESYESIKGSSIVKAMILESNLIIPNDKQYTSMSTYIDFEFESSGLIDVNTYILLDLENEQKKRDYLINILSKIMKQMYAKIYLYQKYSM